MIRQTQFISIGILHLVVKAFQANPQARVNVGRCPTL